MLWNSIIMAELFYLQNWATSPWKLNNTSNEWTIFVSEYSFISLYQYFSTMLQWNLSMPHPKRLTLVAVVAIKNRWVNYILSALWTHFAHQRENCVLWIYLYPNFRYWWIRKLEAWQQSEFIKCREERIQTDVSMLQAHITRHHNTDTSCAYVNEVLKYVLRNPSNQFKHQYFAKYYLRHQGLCV